MNRHVVFIVAAVIALGAGWVGLAIRAGVGEGVNPVEVSAEVSGRGVFNGSMTPARIRDERLRDFLGISSELDAMDRKALFSALRSRLRQCETLDDYDQLLELYPDELLSGLMGEQLLDKIWENYPITDKKDRWYALYSLAMRLGDLDSGQSLISKKFMPGIPRRENLSIPLSTMVCRWGGAV